MLLNLEMTKKVQVGPAVVKLEDNHRRGPTEGSRTVNEGLGCRV